MLILEKILFDTEKNVFHHVLFQQIPIFSVKTVLNICILYVCSRKKSVNVMQFFHHQTWHWIVFQKRVFELEDESERVVISLLWKMRY